MSKVKKIKLKQINYCDSCGYKELFKNNIKVLSGDYYHDKISEKIEGYLQAFNDMKIEYSFIEADDKCLYGCDD